MNTNQTFTVEAAAVINARPETVYGVIADYKGGHRAILPPQFTDMIVREGGTGAGTKLTIKMKVWGQSFTFRQVVTEPQAGHVLMETDEDTGQYTTFTFEPLNGGEQTRVVIYSVFPKKAGFGGWLESKIQAPITQRMYVQELENLEQHIQQHN